MHLLLLDDCIYFLPGFYFFLNSQMDLVILLETQTMHYGTLRARFLRSPLKQQAFQFG